MNKIIEDILYGDLDDGQKTIRIMEELTVMTEEEKNFLIVEILLKLTILENS